MPCNVSVSRSYTHQTSMCNVAIPLHLHQGFRGVHLLLLCCCRTLMGLGCCRLHIARGRFGCSPAWGSKGTLELSLARLLLSQPLISGILLAVRGAFFCPLVLRVTTCKGRDYNTGRGNHRPGICKRVDSVLSACQTLGWEWNEAIVYSPRLS